MTENEWLKAHGVTHAHCPFGCEHPQPYMDAKGEYICGRCAFVDGLRTLMIPCECD